MIGALKTSSPTLKPPERNKTFSEALIALLAGDKIHKEEWQDREYYGVLRQGMLQLHKPDGKFYNWTLSSGDLEGEDYVVLGGDKT